MFFAYQVKNHDNKIKDRELREWYDVLKTRNEWKNERWIIMKKHYIINHKKIMKKLMQVKEIIKIVVKVKRYRGWFKGIIMAKESNSDEENSSDKRHGHELS